MRLKEAVRDQGWWGRLGPGHAEPGHLRIASGADRWDTQIMVGIFFSVTV